MTERVEECKNDWSDGTCPQCGETHYVIVRRSVLAQAKRERDRLRNFVSQQPCTCTYGITSFPSITKQCDRCKVLMP